MTFYDSPITSEDSSYLRFIKMNLDEIPEINKVGRIIQFENGLFVNASSTRVRLFLEKKDFVCHCCGLKTKFATVESNCFERSAEKRKSVHINFYGIDFAGKEVLMTWDHIQPRSLGGKNNLNNAQCLCCYCNTYKGNSYTFESVKQKRLEKGMPAAYIYDNDNVKFVWE